MQSVGKGGGARVFQHVIFERGNGRRKQQKLAIKIIFLCSIVLLVNESWNRNFENYELPRVIVNSRLAAVLGQCELRSS